MLRSNLCTGVVLFALISSVSGLGLPDRVAAEARPSLPAPRAITLEPTSADTLADVPLKAWLFEPPPGQARGAAGVALHGCGGLYDRQGRIRLFIKHGTGPAPILADLRRLLDE